MKAVVRSGWPTVDSRRDEGELQEAFGRVVADPRRVAAVRRLAPLYRPPSDRFDRLTRLAAHLLAIPVALLTLVDSDREFLVSSFGLDDRSGPDRDTPLEDSLCNQVVATGQPLIVPDFSADPDLKSHPAVSALGIRAYAAMPLVTSERWAVGTLCVMDFHPRDWTDDQLANLDMLASICVDEIRFSCLDRQSELDSRWGTGVGGQGRRTRSS